MEVFFAITLSLIILIMWFRSVTREIDPYELRRNTVKARWDRKRIKAERLKQEEKLARKVNKKLEKQKQKDAELITVILPTINKDK